MRPRPSPGRPRSAGRGGGFTLVEILAVVAITGIILAVAAVNLFPSGEQLARREAGQLALDLEQARDSAWFGGLPTAVSFDEGAVRQWRFLSGRWQPQPSKDRRTESSLRIVAMHVEGHALAPGERLVFMPDGLGTPFRVAFEVRGQGWALEGDAAGSVRLMPR